MVLEARIYDVHLLCLPLLWWDLVRVRPGTASGATTQRDRDGTLSLTCAQFKTFQFGDIVVSLLPSRSARLFTSLASQANLLGAS
jgi:hypothetical protein